MRKLLCVLGLVAATCASAAEPASIVFPREVSALLSSPQYIRALEEARRGLPIGHELKVDSASVVTIGNNTYAYITLHKLQVMMFPVMESNYGSIVGSVRRGVEGNDMTIASVYFKPEGEAP